MTRKSTPQPLTLPDVDLLGLFNTLWLASAAGGTFTIEATQADGTQAAAFVASKLLAGTNQQVPGFGPSIQMPGPGSPGYGGPELPGPQQAPGPGTSIHNSTPPAPDLVAAFH